MITAHDVEHAAFGRAQEGKSGYEESSVDNFLDRVVLTLEAIEQGKPLPHDVLKSSDIVDAVFDEKGEKTSGGYDLDDVDDLLDRVAQRLYAFEKQSAPAHADQAHAEEPVGDEPGDLVDNEPRRETSYGTESQRSGAQNPTPVPPLRPAEPVVPPTAPAASEQPAAAAARAEEPNESSIKPAEPVGRPIVVARNGQPLEQPTPVEADRGVQIGSGDSETNRAAGADIRPAETTPAAAGAQQPVANDPAVEQYPATDHRVPLPRGDVNSQLSDEDRRAQNHYHPEYSEYDAAAAANRPAQQTTGQAYASAAGAPVAGSQTTPPSVTPGDAAGSAGRDTSVDREAVTSTPEPAEAATAEPLHVAAEPSSPVQTPTAAASDAGTTTSANTVNSTQTSKIGRPEGIDRPEPIDRPTALPKREDKSRKGLLRRLFRG